MITYDVTVQDNGTQAWRLNGKLHREDGPAVIHLDGAKLWYKEGKHHRLDGPALIRVDGSKEWWTEGIQYSEAAFNESTRPYPITVINTPITMEYDTFDRFCDFLRKEEKKKGKSFGLNYL